MDSTVDDKANKTEDGAGDRAANKAIDNDTTCTAEEKGELKALAQKIGWTKPRAGGVFTHFGGAASGNATPTCCGASRAGPTRQQKRP